MDYSMFLSSVDTKSRWTFFYYQIHIIYMRKGRAALVANIGVIYLFIYFYQMTTAISIEDVRREVKLLKSLSGHQHMVQFYDAFEDDQNVYIVMEYVKASLYPLPYIRYIS